MGALGALTKKSKSAWANLAITASQIVKRLYREFCCAELWLRQVEGLDICRIIAIFVVSDVLPKRFAA